MDSMVLALSVPMLMLSAEHIDVISSTSALSSAIIGLAPQARITFATSFTVT